jgi:hypothetical protein
VSVEDGWLYFLHGWTQVIAEVLHITLDAETFEKLAGIAEGLRPKLVYQPRTRLPMKKSQGVTRVKVPGTGS